MSHYTSGYPVTPTATDAVGEQPTAQVAATRPACRRTAADAGRQVAATAAEQAKTVAQEATAQARDLVEKRVARCRSRPATGNRRPPTGSAP